MWMYHALNEVIMPWMKLPCLEWRFHGDFLISFLFSVTSFFFKSESFVVFVQYYCFILAQRRLLYLQKKKKIWLAKDSKLKNDIFWRSQGETKGLFAFSYSWDATSLLVYGHATKHPDWSPAVRDDVNSCCYSMM